MPCLIPWITVTACSVGHTNIGGDLDLALGALVCHFLV